MKFSGRPGKELDIPEFIFIEAALNYPNIQIEPSGFLRQAYTFRMYKALEGRLPNGFNLRTMKTEEEKI